MRRPLRSLAGALVLGLLIVPFAAGIALAHPLGNFTINHYAGIRVEPSRVLVDVVIDEAEIPTFQATQAFDLDGDGALSAAETAAARQTGCGSVAGGLALTVDGAAAGLSLFQAGLSFPAGNGGLSTMRLVCTFEAALASPVSAGTTIAFRDDFEPTRIGWREMAVIGSGVMIAGSVAPAVGSTDRLTAYPTTLTGAPDVRSVAFTVAPGGPVLAPLAVPDAEPLDAVATPASTAAATAGAPAAVSSVPGGEASIPDVLRNAPSTPLIALFALFSAAILGAGHALTPGHGKTLMAAYLVGTRGTPRHAVGLGLAVSVSHTMGILALAALVLAAETRLPPDLIVRVAPLVAAVSILVIGGWMLFTEARRAIAARRAIGNDEHALDHDHAHEQGHDHAVHHDHGSEHDHDSDPVHDHASGHVHDHPVDAPRDLAHSHGGIRHTHLPPAGSTVTWRSLFVLGLAGGLVPSASALLILLATIAAGRPAWGVILVAAFGLGMAGGHDGHRPRLRARARPHRARAVADPPRARWPSRPHRGRGPRPGPRHRADQPGAGDRIVRLTRRGSRAIG